MPRNNFSEAEIIRIEQSIAEAEKITSGEIRVFIDNRCKEDVLDRAAWIFHEIGMDATKERNGVLIYIAIKDHKFAIIGDAGINAKVPDGFWDAIRDEMKILLKDGKYADAIVTGIMKAGQQLSDHFPYRDNINELSNEMLFGK
jgi:uncharacterized membrane protein